MDSITFSFISMLQSCSSEIVTFLLLILLMILILLAFYTFGAQGLMVYSSVAAIAANIQVLQTAHFSYFPEPMALGTVTFASLFLVSDLLTEHYGPEIAKKNVMLCFFSIITMTLSMIISLGYKPTDTSLVHTSIEVLFMPSLRLLAASLLSFALSQFIEIKLFQILRIWTQNRLLWVRTSVSSLIGALIDNIIFSILAWVVFSSTPVDYKTLLYTYILGTYIARVFMCLATIPIMYLSYFPKKFRLNKFSTVKIPEFS